ncbi:MAG: hypothetical protein FK730_15900 [Asgard group archaeon]|nr:hypothetical protein [Asgard group archaeon]
MEKIDAELASITPDNDVSSSLGQFMGINDDVLGIGIYNIFGNSLFTSSKNQNGELGLTAFKSLLNLVGNQIDFILPPEANVQFIAPEDILVGVSKIGTDRLFAVVLERNARISNIVPNIIQMTKLLKGIARKTDSLSNSKCIDAYRKTIAANKTRSNRKNLIRRFAG